MIRRLTSSLTATIIISLCIAATDAAAAVGKITEQTGPTEIQRNREVIPGAKDSGIETNDTVVTANSKVSINFEDNTMVKITEQSKLVIDSFVYDPAKADAGKVGLKLAMGTARFASGQIAKNNPQSVSIETPTATVGVRGTDFSMTVDEIGRSLIILLPSCPVGYKDIERDCKTGEIFVKTDMGTVHLSKPFQSTRTVSKESNPAKPNILQLTEAQINNMLILAKVKEKAGDENGKNILDRNELDKDLLRFDDLNVNFLDAAIGKLDVNYLQQDFLSNLLDLLNAGLLGNELAEPDDPVLPKYKPNKAFGLYHYYEDDRLTLYKETPFNFASVTVSKYDPATFILNQDGTTLTQNINRSGGTTITVRQGR